MPVEALKAGLRHIDTAQNYLNEGAAGETVAKSGLSKDEVFVTSKHEVRSAIEESKLGFNPDLFLIHSFDVVARSNLKKAWQILEQIKDAGELTEIGVSNFRPQDLELVLDGGKHKPTVNQDRLKMSELCTVDDLSFFYYGRRAMGVVAVTASGNEEHILTQEDVDQITVYTLQRKHEEIEFALPNLPDGAT
ncbi:conjugated polyketone reductase C1 [Lentinula detonsa]|uniref:Conjugated polyketone reductase C1 n=1 Tax=Lentinula detonsa TaxID=2804962 RepID=A0A9W8TZG2_9AGAR|nr:conjugated polyketone reductase C1 [Lentinula detonsa]